MVHLRPALAAMPPAIHGARHHGELVRLGLDPETVLDFSTNSNPYGPHPTVLQAVQTAVTGAALAAYPDRDCLALRAAIAQVEGVPVEAVLPGNGAAELIQLVALACVSPGSRHLVLAPTFGEYARAIALMGGQVVEIRPRRADLRFEVEPVVAAIRRLQPDGVWLCNPNNPTGQQWSAAELAALRAADPADEVLWVVDESYRYFAPAPVSLLAETPGWAGTANLVILRSLTKEHALAGLRLGYALAAPPLVEALRIVQPPWSVNSLAQVAGRAALGPAALAWRQASLARLQADALHLWAGLEALGWPVLPTATPYTLVRVGDAAACRRRLLTAGLLVRDCASFGLPDTIRVAARLPEDNERLLAVLGKNR